jgi:EAL domain-containing protein (putative c-di-GMP-specific phosphodiesterase class I)/CheY-like chemotaxis protein
MNPESQAAAQARTERWKILLVDDEPAVHEVSRLVLADMYFEGQEVELLSANSAAEARDIFSRNTDVALVLLDVVMETDDAGMALVQYIRGHCGAAETQIVLRTGQPGMAPERDVVLRYEINGYVLKTELSAQRLHSIVVSALRNYRHARSLRDALEPDQVRAQPVQRSDTTKGALALELAGLDENNSVLMQAQPEILLASNAVSGIELVPQWKTSLGLLSAARICDALQEGPTQMRIVRWMLSQAIFWARSWRTSAQEPIRVSVPMIGECLTSRGVLTAIIDALHEADLPSGSLDFLVNEATWLGGHPDLKTAVANLHAIGVTFTLTDFGAQRIALLRLHQLVPDRLKIHRLFVREVANDPDRLAVARSLIALAHTLNIEAVADGISSDSDAQFFKWEGCQLGQGDALAPACAPADVAEFLRHGKTSAH